MVYVSFQNNIKVKVRFKITALAAIFHQIQNGAFIYIT